MGDYERYEKQFDALMQVLNRMDVRYGSESASYDRQDTMLYFIRSLRQFAEGQLYFFYHGFNGGKGDYPALYAQISPSNNTIEFPPEHVLASILDQIAADMTIIQLAADQRRLLAGPNAGSQTKALEVKGTGIDLLTAGDRLGTNAFWSPAKADRQDDWGIRTVLTYLTGGTHCRTRRCVLAKL